ncbi:uncharacterized protein MONBRDRAFT_31852 [Monosiga brevicollis MX1]|uniref:DUF389 domain-containing protein n=1 Tax=Monosiga brevicollis TaxID=81824 RepID=A9UVT5_MONBE|nr:uncharacterized protein MONBRDRAFT_31852 [Monosiga brevicollis MX1]EDQ90644.1 predicted protein [Monosiga brevicollis MX1]|eukprot:XP_001744695.1 hypothetical protein [Monosiga brevicollis MX1]
MSAPEMLVVSFKKAHKIYRFRHTDRHAKTKEEAHFLLDKLREALAQAKIKDAIWQESEIEGPEMARADNALVSDSTSAQTTFSTVDNTQMTVWIPSFAGETTERLLSIIQDLGIGEANSNTMLGLMPMVLRLPERSPDEESKKSDYIKARVTIVQIINGLKGSAALTLDYYGLCFAASIIAALGLGRDDTVATVASMLISPLMGPILAFTFGVTIREPDLIRQGLISEAVGLGMCFFSGLAFGLVTGYWGPGWDFPSEFMRSRGTSEGLLVGLGIAIPSGIGVALSVLGNNTGSLVGVAISASLLPPAVNTGLLFGFGIVAAIMGEPERKVSEYFELGGVSFALVLMNILVIFVMGIASLYVKSAIPKITGKSELWHHQIPVYREHQINQGKTSIKMAKQVKKLVNGQPLETVAEEEDVNDYEDELHAMRAEQLEAQRQATLNPRVKDFDSEKAFLPLKGSAPFHPQALRHRHTGAGALAQPTVHGATYTTINQRTQNRGRLDPALFDEPGLSDQPNAQPSSRVVKGAPEDADPEQEGRPSARVVPSWKRDENTTGDVPVHAPHKRTSTVLRESLYRPPRASGDDLDSEATVKESAEQPSSLAPLVQALSRHGPHSKGAAGTPDAGVAPTNGASDGAQAQPMSTIHTPVVVSDSILPDSQRVLPPDAISTASTSADEGAEVPAAHRAQHSDV